jgi:hypothetical protein
MALQGLERGGRAFNALQGLTWRGKALHGASRLVRRGIFWQFAAGFDMSQKTWHM